MSDRAVGGCSRYSCVTMFRPDPLTLGRGIFILGRKIYSADGIVGPSPAGLNGNLNSP